MWAANGKAVGEVVKGAFFQVSSGLHVGAHVPPKPFQQRGKLLAVGRAEVFAEEGLDCTLVGVVGTTNHGDVDAELLKHARVEHALAAEAVEGHPTLGVQVHFIRRRIEVQRALTHVLRPRHDELVAVLQNLQSRSKIFHHGRHDRDVGDVEQDTFDLVILRSALKGVQNLVEPHLHVGFQPAQTEREWHIVATALHDGCIQRHFQNVGILQVDVGSGHGIGVRQRAHQSAHQDTDKNEDQDRACHEQAQG